MFSFPDSRRIMKTSLALLMSVWAVMALAQPSAPVNAGVTPKADVQSYPGLGRPATAKEIAAGSRSNTLPREMRDAFALILPA